ncbi:MAG: T9SS type A sorting domain-containing protein [Flavobacteriales bacterium]|nr:T9SS type A sorting domain-containing protein [Flavobacteriales bacterium]
MKKATPYLIIVSAIFALQFAFSTFNQGTYQAYAFHTAEELEAFDDMIEALPTGFNSIFAASGECELCHGTAGGGPNPTALQDANGKDVSPVADWRATMMANSAKDPFWRAKVSHEIIANPALQQDIENVCTRCHAPNGFFNAIHNGQPHYSISDLEQDSLGLDGVSCTSCHSMLPDGLGNVFSAGMTYDTLKNIYGPYPTPFTNPMVNNIGFTPVQGTHVSQSEACGVCHTLITNPVDLNGIPTGTHFVEQAIYHEWENSVYSSSNPNTCQECHMPKITDNVVIADRPSWLTPRTPFSKHFLVGGNAFMLNLLKNNIDTLKLASNATEFDTVINRTVRQLQSNTLDLTLQEVNRTSDTAFYALELTNKAGHKFPAGYPSRRAYIEFIVQNDLGDTLFHSGKADSQYRLVDEDATYEPHYDRIHAQDQVQIYEMVMGDVNNNVTTVLEYAYIQLKDNRLAPEGFTSTHSNYDTVKVYGAANADPNFNKTGAVEGSGTDSVFYHVFLNGYTGSLTVKANVYYQPLPPKWTDEMFANTSQEIDLFKTLYNSADHTPVIVASAMLGTTGVEEIGTSNIALFPNPTRSNVQLTGLKDIDSIMVYDAKGSLVKQVTWNKRSDQYITLPDTKGLFFIQITTNGKEKLTKKVMHY